MIGDSSVDYESHVTVRSANFIRVTSGPWIYPGEEKTLRLSSTMGLSSTVFFVDEAARERFAEVLWELFLRGQREYLKARIAADPAFTIITMYDNASAALFPPPGHMFYAEAAITEPQEPLPVRQIRRGA